MTSRCPAPGPTPGSRRHASHPAEVSKAKPERLNVSAMIREIPPIRHYVP